MSPEHIAQIRARLAAATPGPWFAWLDDRDHTDEDDGDGYDHTIAQSRRGAVTTGVVVMGAVTKANAGLIASAPTDIADLLAHLDTVTADLLAHLDTVTAERNALLDRVDRLFAALAREQKERRAEVDELAATLANERGEGVPPSEGWNVSTRGESVRWVRVGAKRPGRVCDVVFGRYAGRLTWHWWDRDIDLDGDVITTHAEGYGDTARAAMRAADAAVPK